MTSSIVSRYCAGLSTHPPHYLPAWKDLADTLMVIGREADARELMGVATSGPGNEAADSKPVPAKADGMALTTLSHERRGTC